MESHTHQPRALWNPPKGDVWLLGVYHLKSVTWDWNNAFLPWRVGNQLENQPLDISQGWDVVGGTALSPCVCLLPTSMSCAHADCVFVGVWWHVHAVICLSKSKSESIWPFAPCPDRPWKAISVPVCSVPRGASPAAAHPGDPISLVAASSHHRWLSVRGCRKCQHMETHRLGVLSQGYWNQKQDGLFGCPHCIICWIHNLVPRVSLQILNFNFVLTAHDSAPRGFSTREFSSTEETRHVFNASLVESSKSEIHVHGTVWCLVTFFPVLYL